MAFLEVAGGTILGFALSTIGGLVVRPDEALRESHWKLPTFSPTDESRQAAFDAHEVWQEGWFRVGRMVRDEDLLDRYRTTGWVLMTALFDEQRGKASDTWVAVRAINNARAGFAAFMRDEPVPDPTFPSRDEARRLTKLSQDGHDFSALHEWLEQHPDPTEGG